MRPTRSSARAMHDQPAQVVQALTGGACGGEDDGSTARSRSADGRHDVALLPPSSRSRPAEPLGDPWADLLAHAATEPVAATRATRSSYTSCSPTSRPAVIKALRARRRRHRRPHGGSRLTGPARQRCQLGRFPNHGFTARTAHRGRSTAPHRDRKVERGDTPTTPSGSGFHQADARALGGDGAP